MSPSEVPTVAELAASFAAASAANDAERLAEVFAEQVTLWHNFDAAARQVPGAGLAAVVCREAIAAQAALQDYRRCDEAVHVAADAFIVTRTVRGTAPDGAPVALSQSTTCHVQGGRVSRLDTYYDRQQAAGLLALLSTAG